MKKKDIMIHSFVYVLFILFILLTGSSKIEATTYNSSNSIDTRINAPRTIKADTFSNNKIINNLKIRNYDGVSYYNASDIEAYRQYAYLHSLRDPDNPSKRLNYKDYVPLSFSGKLSQIVITRHFERKLDDSEYRLNGRHYSTLSVAGMHSDLEYYVNQPFYSIEIQLSKDQENWSNGKDASSLYKLLLSKKYKSYSFNDSGLFEFSTQYDEYNSSDYDSDVVIPIESNRILFTAYVPTYIKQGVAVDIRPNWYLWNKNKKEFESFMVLNELYLYSNNERVASTGKIYNSLYVAGESRGSTVVTLKIQEGVSLNFNVGVDELVLNQPDNDRTRAGKWDSYQNKWYFHDSDGELVTGWKTINGSRYYFAPNNVMQTGWQKIDSRWYYFNKSGMLKTGWIKDNNHWYFLQDNGIMLTGWFKFGKNWYYFNNSGMMQTGWVKSGKSWYFMNSDGIMKTGWLKSGLKWYYFNNSGMMLTGWHRIDNHWYYFNPNGTMKTGWFLSGNKWYYMNNSGMMQTGWTKVEDKWYYMNADGHVKTGWYNNGKSWFYLNPAGAMQTGWVKINNTWYYMNSDGVMQVGWIKLGNDWYFFQSNGKLAVNTTIGHYKVDSSGKMIR